MTVRAALGTIATVHVAMVVTTIAIATAPTTARTRTSAIITYATIALPALLSKYRALNLQSLWALATHRALAAAKTVV